MTSSVIRLGKQIWLNYFDFFLSLFQYVEHVLGTQANLPFMCVFMYVAFYIIFKQILLDDRIYKYSSEVLNPSAFGSQTKPTKK